MVQNALICPFLNGILQYFPDCWIHVNSIIETSNTWVIIVFIFCMCAQLLSRVWLFVTPWKACQASLSMEFSSQEYWSWLPFPPLGDLLDPGPCLLRILHWQADSLPLSHPTLWQFYQVIYFSWVPISVISHCNQPLMFWKMSEWSNFLWNRIVPWGQRMGWLTVLRKDWVCMAIFPLWKKASFYLLYC